MLVSVTKFSIACVCFNSGIKLHSFSFFILSGTWCLRSHLRDKNREVAIVWAMELQTVWNFCNFLINMTILSLLMLMLIFINCHRTYLLTHSFTQFLSVLSIGNFTERNKELENGLSIQNFGKSIWERSCDVTISRVWYHFCHVLVKSKSSSYSK